MTAPNALRHVGLFYDDTDTVAAQIADTIELDRGAGAAVLVSLRHGLAAAVSKRLGTEDRVTFLPSDDRYDRPVTAIHSLWNFTKAALADGATRVQTVGEISFDGSPRDDDWHWYERAVNDVFADVPLTATCLFDTGTVSPVTIACAHATHAQHIGQVVDTPARCDIEGLLPGPVLLPRRDADLVLEGTSRPGAARHALELFGDLAPDVFDRARLVVSELVTNAIIHGGGRADVRYWHEPNAIFLEVTDDGAGIADPFATLRPPDLPRRGVGLWASHVEATRLHVAGRRPHGTIVTACITEA
jgi:anti-sigma regulatory factor (Ser/Thr protein kinase)